MCSTRRRKSTLFFTFFLLAKKLLTPNSLHEKVFLVMVVFSHRNSEFQPQTIDFFFFFHKEVEMSHEIDVTFLFFSTNIIFEFQLMVLVSQLP